MTDDPYENFPGRGRFGGNQERREQRAIWALAVAIALFMGLCVWTAKEISDRRASAEAGEVGDG